MCFFQAPFVQLSCEDVTGWRLLAPVNTWRRLETADKRQKQETCGVAPQAHLTTEDWCAYTLDFTHKLHWSRNTSVYASRLPLPQFLADEMAFNLKEGKQRASVRMGKSTKQRARKPHSPSLPFKGPTIQPPQPARILGRSMERVGGCS